MSYKIVIDSSGELPKELRHDSHFEIIPFELRIGEERIWDDESFQQAEFLKKVAESPVCPQSACPSPERFLRAFETGEEDIYVITISGNLSGCYNSAKVAQEMYHEDHPNVNIHVFDSCSASCGETQAALVILEKIAEGLKFEQIVEVVKKYLEGMNTYFVLDNLETLRKNGRLSTVKALVASKLSIKPIMGANIHGEIKQLGQAVGMKKALQKMAEMIAEQKPDAQQRRLMITHCNCPERAEKIKQLILEKVRFRDVIILDTDGLSSLYANDGGVIVTA